MSSNSKTAATNAWGRTHCLQESDAPGLLRHPSSDEHRHARHREKAEQPATDKQGALLDADELRVLLQDACAESATAASRSAH